MKRLLVLAIFTFLPFTSMAYDADVAQTQSNLSMLGYDPGPFDGKMGPSTVSAVRSFQGDHALEQSGNLNMQTLKAINKRLTAKMMDDMKRYNEAQAGR